MSKVKTLAKANPLSLISLVVAVAFFAIALATPAKADTANYLGTYTCQGNSDGTLTIAKFAGPTPTMVKAWGDGCGYGRSIEATKSGVYLIPSTCHWNFTFQIDSKGYWEYVPNEIVPDATGQTRVIMNYKGSGCKVENTAPWGNAQEGAALRLGDANAPAYSPLPRR